jgi:AcrR family transcriptional regulator
MPALAKTTDAEIARAARRLFEKGDDFSMTAVAAAVGIRAPSLYKRFADRDAIVARVRRDAYDALGATVAKASRDALGSGGGDRARLHAIALAYRAFAARHPRLYSLLFEPGEDDDDLTARARAASAEPALELLRRVAGEAHALDAARTLTAFLHGHVSMVQAGAFRLGGDVEQAFSYGLELLLDGLAKRNQTKGNVGAAT